MEEYDEDSIATDSNQVFIYAKDIPKEKVKARAEAMGFKHVERKRVNYTFRHEYKEAATFDAYSLKWTKGRRVRVLGENQDVYEKGKMIIACSASYMPVFNEEYRLPKIN